MISERKERTIGKIITVDAYNLEVELLDSINSFNINGFDDVYQFIRLNGYVLVCIDNDFIVASISAIREKDTSSFSQTDKDALNKIRAIKLLDLFPLGVISKKEFSFGVSNYPMLYSDVLYIKEEELRQLFSSNSSNTEKLNIGNWTLMDKYEIEIDINNFFGFHSAILGNTGSGKSCTISTIIQSVFKANTYPRAKFVFFDVNGEYKKAFTNEKEEALDNIKLQCYGFTKNNNDKPEQSDLTKNFYLPLDLLSIDEWELLLKASSKSQAPILRNALKFYGINNNDKNKIIAFLMKSVYDSNDGAVGKYQIIQGLKNKLFPKDGESYENIDSGYDSKYGNFPLHEKEKEFLDKLKEIYGTLPLNIDSFEKEHNNNITLKKLDEHIELAIMWEEAHGNKQIKDYCSSMITRLKSLSTREEFTFFNSDKESKGNVADANKYIDNIIGDKNITIINFDNIDDEVIEVVSSVLTRILFDQAREQPKRNTEPVHLVLDEAHRYISRNRGKEYFFEANRIFERVAKEARKYGLFLILSSQRPSELNETVLSQCSNFIIHRIQNPDDLNYIRSMTPYISKAILNQLPSIPRQEALIFGTATNLPVLFKVKDANPLPDSKNNDISKNWQSK